MEEKRGRFVLALEDVVGRGDVSFPKVDSPHPPERVRAVLDAYASLHVSCWSRPPRGVWTDAISAAVTGGPPTRPPFLRVISDTTLANILKRWPDLLPPSVVATYRLFLEHYDLVRAHWSRAARDPTARSEADNSAETSRGDAAATTWIFRGDDRM